MAELLKRQLGVDAELIEGNVGEFTIWVDQKKVASKEGDEYPREGAVVDAVRSALKKPSP